jgi:hypothetical protein
MCNQCYEAAVEDALRSVLEENEHGEEQSSLMDLDCQPAGELREGVLEEKEKQHYLALHAKFGGKVAAAPRDQLFFGPGFGDGGGENEDNEQEHEHDANANNRQQQDKLEQQSARSGESQHSKISRSTIGRFEGKYKVGDRTAGGAVIKEVREEDWEFVEKDKKGNSYYKCIKCLNAARIRKEHRKTHTCK